jgi:putative ABC transport system substrate-binding protein
MRELGYVEGETFVIEARFANGQYERLPGLSAELVNLKVDVIVAQGTPATSAAQKATMKIPIVFGSAGDPVGSGFVKSLAHPGGNITGFSVITSDLAPKHLEMLLTMAPKLARVAVLMNPTTENHPQC